MNAAFGFARGPSLRFFASLARSSCSSLLFALLRHLTSSETFESRVGLGRMVARPGAPARQSRRCEAADGLSQISGEGPSDCFDWTRHRSRSTLGQRCPRRSFTSATSRRSTTWARWRCTRCGRSASSSTGTVRRAARAVGLRQVDAAQHHRRPGRADERPRALSRHRADARRRGAR